MMQDSMSFLQDSLRMDSNCRTELHENAIEDFLLGFPALREAIHAVSKDNTKRLVECCFLREINMNHSYTLTTKDRDIFECFAVLSLGQQESISSLVTVEEYNSVIFGQSVLLGKQKWRETIRLPKNTSAILVVIPAIPLLQYIGIGGPEPALALELFWKYSRLMSLMDHPRRTPIYYDSTDLNSNECDSKPILNLINSGRIKVFLPGQDIFRQGERRHAMYFVVHGECTLLRRIRNWQSKSIQCNELNTEQRYQSGDFIFMDSETDKWLKTYKFQLVQSNQTKANAIAEKLSLEKLSTQSDENSAILESTGNQAYFRQLVMNQRVDFNPLHFGYHKNSLFSLTRVEICVIPLFEIAKNDLIFTELFKLSMKKYSRSYADDDTLVSMYHNHRMWNFYRQKCLIEIRKDYESRQLNENFHIVANSNVNKDYCNAHTPNHKINKFIQQHEESKEYKKSYEDAITSLEYIQTNVLVSNPKKSTDSKDLSEGTPNHEVTQTKLRIRPQSHRRITMSPKKTPNKTNEIIDLNTLPNVETSQSNRNDVMIVKETIENDTQANIQNTNTETNLSTIESSNETTNQIMSSLLSSPSPPIIDSTNLMNDLRKERIRPESTPMATQRAHGTNQRRDIMSQSANVAISQSQGNAYGTTSILSPFAPKKSKSSSNGNRPKSAIAALRNKA